MYHTHGAVVAAEQQEHHLLPRSGNEVVQAIDWSCGDCLVPNALGAKGVRKEDRDQGLPHHLGAACAGCVAHAGWLAPDVAASQGHGLVHCSTGNCQPCGRLDRLAPTDQRLACLLFMSVD